MRVLTTAFTEVFTEYTKFFPVYSVKTAVNSVVKKFQRKRGSFFEKPALAFSLTLFAS